MHIGSFFAVLTYFHKDVVKFIKNRDLFIKIIISSFPVMLIGYIIFQYNIIEELRNIVPLKSATGIVIVRNNSFFVEWHFPDQPVMPGVLIVEAFGQAAAALTAHGIDPKEYKDKLVFLMSVDKARFRNPVIPNCELHLEIEAIRSHGRVWKYKGTAKVEGKRMADAEWSATIVDRK